MALCGLTVSLLWVGTLLVKGTCHTSRWIALISPRYIHTAVNDKHTGHYHHLPQNVWRHFPRRTMYDVTRGKVIAFLIYSQNDASIAVQYYLMSLCLCSLPPLGRDCHSFLFKPQA